MGRNVPMTLLKTLVFANPMQIVLANNDGLPHLCGDDDAAEETAANGNVAGEWALLVDVSSFDGLTRSLDTEADVSEPSALLSPCSSDKGDGALLGEALIVEDISHIAVFQYADGDGGAKRKIGGSMSGSVRLRMTVGAMRREVRARRRQHWTTRNETLQ